MTNHYRTLGVDPGADLVVIRGAYLALIRRYHPDKGGEEADPARAQAVTAAWDVLRDPTRRAAYDDSRCARFEPDVVSAGGGAIAGRASRVRGGAAGRNLFLLLAAATVGLGWWALGQPQLTPPPVKVAAPATRPLAPLAEPAIRPADTRDVESAAQPPLPDVRREPADVPVIPPPLPITDPVRLPVRGAAPTATSLRPERQAAAPERPRPAPAAAQRAEAPVAAAAPAPATATTAPPRIDLAALERHLQLLTDQSFRFGTEAKKARLISSREGFLTRLRTCTTDSCKRDAYLRRNAEIGEIMRN